MNALISCITENKIETLKLIKCIFVYVIFNTFNNQLKDSNAQLKTIVIDLSYISDWFRIYGVELIL
jgi:hypothetical protein